MSGTTTTAARNPDEPLCRLWFLSLPQARVSATRLVDLVAQHGLTDVVEIPPRIPAIIAFAATCAVGTWAQYTVTPKQDDGQADGDPIHVRLEIEHRDPNQPACCTLVRYCGDEDHGTTVAELSLVPTSYQVSPEHTAALIIGRDGEAIEQLSDEEQVRVRAELKKINADYNAARDQLVDGALKDVLAQIVLAAHGVWPTDHPGLYVLPGDSQRTVDAIRHIVTELTPADARGYVVDHPVCSAQPTLVALINNAVNRAIDDNAEQLDTLLTASDTAAATTDHAATSSTHVYAAQAPANVVGHLVLQDIAEFLVPAHTLPSQLAAHDLTPYVTLPGRTDPIEAVHTACTPSLRAEYPVLADTGDHETTVRLEVDLLDEWSEMTVYRVIRRWDGEAGPGETTIASIWVTPTVADGTSGQRFAIHYDPAWMTSADATDEYTTIEQVLTDIEAAYEGALATFPPHALASVVDQILSAADGIKLHDVGDVLFVPAHNQHMLTATSRLVTALAANRSDTHMALLPVTAGSDLAELISDNIGSQLHMSITGLATELRECATGGLDANTCDTGDVAALDRRTEQLAERITGYHRVLSPAVQRELARHLRQVRQELAAHSATPPIS